MVIDREIRNVFEDEGLYLGRCVGSKIGYFMKHPDNDVAFNARVYDKSLYESHKEETVNPGLGLWYGDLDLTLDLEKLQKVAVRLGQDLVVTRESGDKVKEINLADIVK